MSAQRFGRERRALRMVSLRPKQFWLGTAAWLVFFVFPLVPGSLIRGAYDELERNGVSGRFLAFAFGLVAAEIAMGSILAVGHSVYMAAFEAIESLVRGNVLHAQLASGGPESASRSVSSGDVVTRLRDDPKDMLMLVDNWVDVVGSVAFGAIALTLLARIDALAALVMLVPLLAFGFGNRFAGHRLRRVRSAARESTSEATDYLNSAFGAALTVKVTGAEDGVLQRVDRLNRRRSAAMVTDQTWGEALWAVNGSVGDVCIGTALVVAARRLDNAGDVALFAAYAMNLIWLPQKIGGALVGRRRFDVSAARLDALLPSPDLTVDDIPPSSSPSSSSAPPVVAPSKVAPVAASSKVAVDPAMVRRPLPILGGPAAPPIVRPPRIALDVLEVCGLTVLDRGVVDLSFTLRRGTLTVISGPVGSGKTSVLRALTGLIDIDAGVVTWNGATVLDRAAFFVPPQCALVSQVPHLFSETLLDNVLLGSTADPTEAIRMAAFDGDVGELRDGLATPIGAGGVRLSGGQAQRAAAARALIHDTELIVLDDLTSALDVDTEVLLWQRLAASGRTVLAVSNRPVAVQRADQHIVLSGLAGRAFSVSST